MALFLCLNLIQLMKHFAIMQGAFYAYAIKLALLEVLQA